MIYSSVKGRTTVDVVEQVPPPAISPDAVIEMNSWQGSAVVQEPINSKPSPLNPKSGPTGWGG